jgi:hypothetical protein
MVERGVDLQPRQSVLLPRALGAAAVAALARHLKPAAG